MGCSYALGGRSQCRLTSGRAGELRACLIIGVVGDRQTSWRQLEVFSSNGRKRRRKAVQMGVRIPPSQNPLQWYRENYSLGNTLAEFASIDLPALLSYLAYFDILVTCTDAYACFDIFQILLMYDISVHCHPFVLDL